MSMLAGAAAVAVVARGLATAARAVLGGAGGGATTAARLVQARAVRLGVVGDLEAHHVGHTRLGAEAKGLLYVDADEPG